MMVSRALGRFKLDRLESLDTKAIEQAFGKPGELKDDVYDREDVNHVTKALPEHGIHGSPDLYFVHFWADDTAER